MSLTPMPAAGWPPGRRALRRFRRIAAQYFSLKVCRISALRLLGELVMVVNLDPRQTALCWLQRCAA